MPLELCLVCRLGAGICCVTGRAPQGWLSPENRTDGVEYGVGCVNSVWKTDLNTACFLAASAEAMMARGVRRQADGQAVVPSLSGSEYHGGKS